MDAGHWIADYKFGCRARRFTRNAASAPGFGEEAKINTVFNHRAAPEAAIIWLWLIGGTPAIFASAALFLSRHGGQSRCPMPMLPSSGGQLRRSSRKMEQTQATWAKTFTSFRSDRSVTKRSLFGMSASGSLAGRHELWTAQPKNIQ